MKTKRNLTILATTGLILIMLMAILFAAGRVSFDTFSLLLLAGTLIWFGGILTANRQKQG